MWRTEEQKHVLQERTKDKKTFAFKNGKIWGDIFQSELVLLRWLRIRGTRCAAGLPEVQSLPDPWNALWEPQQTGLWRGGKPLGRKTRGEKGTCMLTATLPSDVTNKATQTWTWLAEVLRSPMTEHSLQRKLQVSVWNRLLAPFKAASQFSLCPLMLLLIQSLRNVSLSLCRVGKGLSSQVWGTL